jgi:tRNA-specific 2-thiouridylase
VAAALGMPHRTLDYRDGFLEEVIEPFVSAYMKGLTPNPCIECNARIKFGKLYEYARGLGFDTLVTGHYARITSAPDGTHRLEKAKDAEKDQSYFLYRITPEKLENILFPLGDYSKHEVRAIAKDAGFGCADRAESQDICFVPDGDHGLFIEGFLGKSSAPGNFVDAMGNILGRHDGIVRYTIGQRKGLGVALGRPVFVKEIRFEANEIVLAGEEEVFAKTINIEDAVLHVGVPQRTQIMVRYRAIPVWASVRQGAEGLLVAEFDEPVRAPAGGQSAVFYDGDIVVGGGRIV